MIPGVLFALEGGQAAIFLTTPIADSQTWIAFVFQLAYSIFKNTGIKDKVMFKVLGMIGMPVSPARQAEKRTDLAVIASSHNFAEIMSVVLMLVVLAADTVCRGAGLKEGGSLEKAAPPYYVKPGMLGAWQNGIPSSETAAVLLIILFGRIFATRFEERHFHSIYGPRKTDIANFVRLVLSKGPSRQRVMCYFFVFAQILIVTCRLPYYGHYFAKSEKNAPADDDD